MVLRAFSKRLLLNRISAQHRYFQTSGGLYKIVQFLLSDIGEGIREVSVSEWFVKEGDKVVQFDNICCVESDKASVNITSRYDGVVKKIYYEVGDKALVGKPLVDIDTDEADSGSSSEESSMEDEKPAVNDKEIPSVPSVDIRQQPEESINDIYRNKALATPAVRRLAMEHDIRLSSITGSGKSGRVLKEDILKYLNSTSTPSPVSDPITPSALSDMIPITGIKRVMFNTMTQSNLIPYFNFFEEIDLTKLIRLKKEVQPHLDEKLRLTYMPFFIKSLSKALCEFPIMNAYIDAKQENLIQNRNHNIGFAVDTKSGLVVPNIKNVESRNIIGIAKEINRILEKGKDGFFNPSDLKGGTITISNVGMIGGTCAGPRILPPEVAIVALGRIMKRPIFTENDEITSAHILYSSWAADHRVIDGATLARFVQLWKHYLENPSVLILDL